MNQKIKYVGILAIVPIFMIALAQDYIGEADAATQYSKGTPNQSFGSADHLFVEEHLTFKIILN